jgi:shikimate kinase
MARTCPVRKHHALVLMGLRGSGKSTLGPALAQRLGRDFIDLDDRVAASLCAQHSLPSSTSIGDLFKQLGEAEFRRVEAAELARCLGHDQTVESSNTAQETGLVLALGGGTPTAPGASELLRAACAQQQAWMVYLRLSPSELANRLRASENQHRPALMGTDPIAEVAQVFAVRDPLYRELASITIELDGTTAEQAIELILQAC